MNTSADAAARHVAIRTLLFDLRARVDLLKDVMQRVDSLLKGVMQQENASSPWSADDIMARLQSQESFSDGIFCWDRLGTKLLRLLPNNVNYSNAFAYAIETAKVKLNMSRYDDDVVSSAVKEDWQEAQFNHFKFTGVMMSMFLHWVISDIDHAHPYQDEFTKVFCQMYEDGYISPQEMAADGQVECSPQDNSPGAK